MEKTCISPDYDENNIISPEYKLAKINSAFIGGSDFEGIRRTRLFPC